MLTVVKIPFEFSVQLVPDKSHSSVVPGAMPAHDVSDICVYSSARTKKKVVFSIIHIRPNTRKRGSKDSLAKQTVGVITELSTQRTQQVGDAEFESKLITLVILTQNLHDIPQSLHVHVI